MPRGSGRNGKPKAGMSGLGKFMPNGAGGAAYHAVEDKADWSSVHPDFVAASVVAVNRAGGAILFGADRKNTQFAITLFFSGDKNTFYWFMNAIGASQVEEWLSNLISELASDGDDLQGG